MQICFKFIFEVSLYATLRLGRNFFLHTRCPYNSGEYQLNIHTYVCISSVQYKYILMSKQANVMEIIQIRKQKLFQFNLWLTNFLGSTEMHIKLLFILLWQLNNFVNIRSIFSVLFTHSVINPLYKEHTIYDCIRGRGTTDFICGTRLMKLISN